VGVAASAGTFLYLSRDRDIPMLMDGVDADGSDKNEGVTLVLPLHTLQVVEHNFLSPLSRAAAFVNTGVSRKIELRVLVEVLERAAKDPAVKSLRAEFGGKNPGLGPAQIEELRNAVTSFNESRGSHSDPVPSAPSRPTKSSSCTAPTFQDQGLYWLASAFEEVIGTGDRLGYVHLVGLSSVQLFAREMLEKVGIVPEVFAREKYKKAFASFSDQAMTPEHLENVVSVLGSLHDTMASSVLAGRGGRITMDWHGVLGAGPLEFRKAVSAGLVDRVALKNEKKDKEVTLDNYLKVIKIRERAKHISRMKEKFWEAQKMCSSPGEAIRFILSDDRPSIGIVHVSGTIVDNYGGNSTEENYDVITALRAAGKNKKIGAVVLRVDSPGGSPEASEAIWNTIIEVRDLKPVICSMGNSAASGGYYIAAPCSKIFASRSTLTGSIGVVGAQPNLSGLLESLGVNIEHIATGPDAGIDSPFLPLTERKRGSIERRLDQVYERFLTVVAEGRGMDPVDVRARAGGRVWTGEQAVLEGLVDNVGGLACAIECARGEFEGGAEAPVRVMDGRSGGSLVKFFVNSGNGSIPDALWEVARVIAKSTGISISRNRDINGATFDSGGISRINIHDDWVSQWLDEWMG